MVRKKFSQNLLKWFNLHGRHDLPWQQQLTPYRVWVSEIMLQQTQVATVIPYFHRFVQAFPTVHALADADIDTVLSHWAGLGYYARGRNLHRAAKILCQAHAGKLPPNREKLLALPGIGKSTAHAIMAIAFKQRYAILESNVKRVLSRFYAISGDPSQASVLKKLWQLAQDNTPRKNVDAYTQAIMDLGATVCTKSKPKCIICPLSYACIAKQQQAQHEYPTAKAKKLKPLRKTIFMILQKKSGEILLQKRPLYGVWGGLWGFPECSHNTNIQDWLSAKIGSNATIIEKMPIIAHTLTHFTLQILPVRFTVKNYLQIADMQDQQWHLLDNALKLGLPTPVKNLLLTMAE
ncbi:A/G-specific adenine glycosylase [uncultured Candidatus Thioglobus sp.]|nr:A/G-specific adenine glycosylase [uncultured Candidatus Thioglobus sp.]